MDDFKNAFSLNGKTALVIGAGGLGLPIARALLPPEAEEGSRLHYENFCYTIIIGK